MTQFFVRLDIYIPVHSAVSGPETIEKKKVVFHVSGVQSFHKKPSTQPRSKVPLICSSFRVNEAENQ